MRAVFFDFAGTLFDDRRLRDVHLRQLRFVADRAGLCDASELDLRDAYRAGLRTAYRAVAATPSYSHRGLFAATYRAMADALGATIDEASAQEAVDRQYEATIRFATLRSDCLATLETLRSSGHHIQIVSNVDDEQLRPMVKRLRLASAVDAVTSSEEAQSCKPDPTIFRHALAKACVTADETLFVGDSLTHDVLGPAGVGMRTAWLARSGADEGPTRPDHVIHELGEVLAIVEAS